MTGAKVQILTPVGQAVTDRTKPAVGVQALPQCGTLVLLQIVINFTTITDYHAV